MTQSAGDSACQMPACFTPHHPYLKTPLSADYLRELAETERDFLLLHGGCFRSMDAPSDDQVRFASFFMFPSLFPRDAFDKAMRVQPLMNKLYCRVAHHPHFLTETLKTTIEVDDFTAALFRIYSTVLDESGGQFGVTLGLLRCDYFAVGVDIASDTSTGPDVAGDSGASGGGASGGGASGDGGGARVQFSEHQCCVQSVQLAQVETNTIAAGWSGMSEVSSTLHRYVIGQLGFEDKMDHIPQNRSLEGISDGMLCAYDHYGVEGSALLFVVEDRCANLCDQRFHELAVCRRRAGLRVLRRSHSQLITAATLNEQRQLIVDGVHIAVVYYRTGYTPRDYPTADHWQVRLLLERSAAIKCPSVQLHLAGTKKVQQQLTRPGVLEQFLDSPQEVALCRSVFAKLYSLDLTSDGDASAEMALQSPDQFVLKPQREGGGNNIYGRQVALKLAELGSSADRCAFILMDRLWPLTQVNYLLRPSPAQQQQQQTGQQRQHQEGHEEEAGRGALRPQRVDSVSELGIFGYILCDGSRVLHNECCGFTLRSKPAGVEEGGIAAGLGAMDSPFLI